MELILTVAGFCLGLMIVVIGFELLFELFVEDYLLRRGINITQILKIHLVLFTCIGVAVYVLSRTYLSDEFACLTIGIFAYMVISKIRNYKNEKKLLSSL